MHHCDTLFVHCDSSITVRKRVASGERKEKFVLPRAFVISKEYCMTQLLSTARPLPSFRGRKNPTPPLKRYEKWLKIQIIHESSVNPMQIANIMCGILDGKRRSQVSSTGNQSYNMYNRMYELY